MNILKDKSFRKAGFEVIGNGMNNFFLFDQVFYSCYGVSFCAVSCVIRIANKEQYMRSLQVIIKKYLIYGIVLAFLCFREC